MYCYYIILFCSEKYNDTRVYNKLLKYRIENNMSNTPTHEYTTRTHTLLIHTHNNIMFTFLYGTL